MPRNEGPDVNALWILEQMLGAWMPPGCAVFKFI